jgi:hypothetical protein
MHVGFVAARAAYQVGVCYEMLGERPNALRWYQRAKEKADEAERTQVKDLEEIEADWETLLNALVGFTLVGAPIALYRRRKWDELHDQNEQLRDRIWKFKRSLRDYSASIGG